MAAPNDTPASLVGKSFDCIFGSFVPRLTILSPSELRVQATIGETLIDEVVKSDLNDVRPGVFVVNWTEQNGTFVVQVQDHENKSFIILHGFRTVSLFAPKAQFNQYRQIDSIRPTRPKALKCIPQNSGAAS